MNLNQDKKAKLVAINRKTNEICKLAMDMFANAYGQEVGNCCLKFMPFGGLYLAGGISPKNIELLKDPNGSFLQSLHHKVIIIII